MGLTVRCDVCNDIPRQLGVWIIECIWIVGYGFQGYRQFRSREYITLFLQRAVCVREELSVKLLFFLISKIDKILIFENKTHQP